MIFPAVALLASLAVSPAIAHHPVSTQNVQAQALFDRGLTLYYAYNGAQAVHIFAQAAALDPKLAMAHWGEALGYGADVNVPVDEPRYDAAHAAIEAAAALEAGASPRERAYIEAMRVRYRGHFKDLAVNEIAYRAAMKALMQADPGDDDAAALYAEELFEQRKPLWKAGTSQPDPDGWAPEIAAVLDAVNAHNPDHLMINHLYVHIFESSADHSRAVAAAKRLDALTYAPEDEHLAHMTAHTWIDVGEYRKAEAATRRALALFTAYLAAPENDRTHARYVRHDVMLGFEAATMIGDDAGAQEFAAQWDGLKKVAFFSVLSALRAQQWPDVVRLGRDQPVFSSYRALAQAMLGNTAAANDELKRPLAAPELGYAAELARAQLAIAAGNSASAAEHFRAAQKIESKEFGGEYLPAIPTSEIAGPYFERTGKVQDAYAVYKSAADQYPNDPRAYAGMARTLRALGRTAEANAALEVYRKNWAGAPLLEQLSDK